MLEDLFEAPVIADRPTDRSVRKPDLSAANAGDTSRPGPPYLPRVRRHQVCQIT